MVYNTKYIDYGDYVHIQHYDRSISRVDLPEEEQKKIDLSEKEAIKSDFHDIEEEKEPDQKKQEHSLKVSVNRSKNNLFRIARSNTWDLFVTLTFRREDIDVDCSDYNQVSAAMTKWLNMIRRSYCPDLKYLAVPELHKDKIHYHYHILMSNCDDLPLKFSGRVDHLGADIYNLPRWDYGFSTASKIKDQSRVRNYIGKYITKDLMNNLKYKKRYYASQNVNICDEHFKMFTLEEIYNLFGVENIAHAKTICIEGVNRIQYFEIKKETFDIIEY